jgi:hypothetical protein
VPDEFTLARSARLADVYTRYRAQLDQTATGDRWMPYRWWSLPNPLSGAWLIYATMVADYATDLANIINDLTHQIHRLRAWAKVVEPMTNEEKLEIAHEFVGMLGIVALGAPYAIKSRFALAAASLCHQANQAKGVREWKDEFPTENLYLNDVDPFGEGWKAYRPFKRKVEPIAGRRFKAETDDFRNAYNHGFSPRLLLGVTNAAKRIVHPKTKRVSYGIGGTPPLDLNKAADLLSAERDHCYRAFEAFQRLVAEHTVAISAYEAAHAPPA